MVAVQAKKLMTTEEFLTLPDDGIERMLIRGELREGTDMSLRGRNHTRTLTKLARFLDVWLSTQNDPRGEILAGDQAFRFANDPDSTFGIDVAYITAELAGSYPSDVFIVGGTPVLAVEVLSPSDKYQDVTDKLTAFLDAGVPLVWSVDPVFQTVTVYRPGLEPVLISKTQTLEGGDQLPGFRLKVEELFGH